MQQITILGNLGRDPEERVTASGKKMVSFSVAVNVRGKDTVWYKCIIWQEKLEQFRGILQHLHKGSRVCLTGALGVPEAYADKGGVPAVRLLIEPVSIYFAGAADKKDPSALEDQTELPF